MRYLVKVNSIKEKTKILEKELDNIDSKINELEEAQASIVWKGEAATMFNDIYSNYLEDLYDIEKKILSYIKFLMAYSDKYGNAYSELQKKYAHLFEEELHGNN